MKKLLPGITLSLIIFLAIFLFIPKSVFADGMAIKFDPYSDRWDYSNESNQQAFINYENGLQKMIISVGFEGENSEGVVWLFPVPADPDKVAIDVVKSLPELKGEEISKKAKSSLTIAASLAQITQLYTFPFAFMNALSATADIDTTGLGTTGIGFGDNVQPDVVVYEHIDKEGVSSEIITAKTVDGLYNYLQNKGLKIETGSISILNNYIGKEYSFVVSWINPTKKNITLQYVKELLNKNYPSYDRWNFLNLKTEPNKFDNTVDNLKLKYGFKPSDNKCVFHSEKYQECNGFLEELTQAISNDPSIIDSILAKDQKGVLVTFPTKEVYFPLLPTSVYGSKIVPATIRIVGHVSPKIFQDIKNYTKTDYYIDSYANFTDDLKNFYSGQNRDIKYTKIEINAPSKFLTNDLWISAKAPIKTYYSTFIAIHPLVDAVILLILSSILAGILAGLIIFKDLRRKPVKLGLIGLSNCLTIFGLIITTALVKTKNEKEGVNILLAEIKLKGYLWKRRVAAILCFISAPFVFSSIIVIYEICEKIYNHRYLNSMFTLDLLIINLFIAILLIVLFVFAFVIKRIKSKDRNLFKQLKLAGYSSWTFYPKDKMKYVFVPVFSVSFLVISWLLFKLFQFTV